MTRLTDDLRALTGPHLHRKPDDLVQIPLGALRAAIVMLERYEGWQMGDRYVMPDWLAYQAAQKLPGGKHEAMVLARRGMRR